VILWVFVLVSTFWVIGQNGPNLRPHEAALERPINGFGFLRIDSFTIGDPDSGGKYNPTVYFTLFSVDGRKSDNHAVSLKDLFSINLNPDLNTIKSRIVVEVDKTYGSETNLVQ
jgi:hypothetical protein